MSPHATLAQHGTVRKSDRSQDTFRSTGCQQLLHLSSASLSGKQMKVSTLWGLVEAPQSKKYRSPITGYILLYCWSYVSPQPYPAVALGICCPLSWTAASPRITPHHCHHCHRHPLKAQVPVSQRPEFRSGCLSPEPGQGWCQSHTFAPVTQKRCVRKVWLMEPKPETQLTP